VLTASLRRLLRGIPAVGVVLLLALLLLKEPPDPSTLASLAGNYSLSQHPQNQRLQKMAWRQQRGYDKPIFYFSVMPACLSDSLRTIPEAAVRQSMKHLSLLTGNGEAVMHFYYSLLEFQDAVYDNFQSSKGVEKNQARLFITEADRMMRTADPEAINAALQRLDTLTAGPVVAFEHLKSAWQRVVSAPRPWRRYIPSLRWHRDCRFHQWVWGTEEKPGLLRGSLGRSYRDGRPVSDVLLPRLRLTLALSVIALLLATPLSLLLTFLTWHTSQLFQRLVMALTYGLYAIPAFVMGSLLIVFFTGGRFLDWFPAYGSGEWPEGVASWQGLRDNFAYFILPLFCWSYGALCYFFMQERRTLREAEVEPWFTTLRAKGLPDTRIFFRHILPVILVPVATLLGQYFPVLLGGSIVLEVLFSLPGMGELTYHAVADGDVPLLLAIVLLGSLATLISFLVSDLLVIRLDPRAGSTEPKRSL